MKKMEGRTVLVLVEGETTPIIGHWVEDSMKAVCVMIAGRSIWFPRSLTMDPPQNQVFEAKVADPAVKAYTDKHPDEAGKVYYIFVPVWFANEKEIPGFDEDVPECVTITGGAPKAWGLPQERPKPAWGNAWDFVTPGHKASCKMCGYPTDGSHFCPECQKAILQERADGLQKVLDVHCVTCVEDLPPEALKAHQVRYGVRR